MRVTLLAVCAALLAAGCGGAGHTSPPSAASLAHRIGCQVLGSGRHFASQYTVQDIDAGGPASCQADEVYTFRTQADETKWLTAYSTYGSSIGSCLYMLTGSLWAVDLAGGADGTIRYGPLQQAIGGKQWTGGC